jgi:[histone H3]-lysine36 N-dimethyltransferase SETMAR
MEKNICKEHLRHCLLYEYHRKSSAKEAFENLRLVYCLNVVCYETVKRWFKRFRKNDFSLNDSKRLGRPSSINNNEIVEVLEEKNSTTISKNWIIQKFYLYTS